MNQADSKRTLDRLEPALPNSYYYDPDHYQREIETFWYRHWLYACRSAEVAAARDYRVIQVGDQSIVIVRTPEGTLSAFHNTCRHRGSALCPSASGRLNRDSVVCPYHAWTYALSGELISTPRRLDSADFRAEDFSLHRVASGEWGGYVFVNLEPEPEEDLATAIGGTISRFGNWHPGDLVLAHRETVHLACNWKVFWENFSECYHCPGVHPELCEVVPTYRDGLLSPSDRPEWQPTTEQPGRVRPPLADGAVTWSYGGTTELPWFEGLTEAEQRAGHSYGVLEPSGFLVGHVDYMRAVYMQPRGPEQTELTVEWLFHPETLESEDFDVAAATSFGRLVVEQDGRACEVHQQGLRCRRQDAGVLVPQEYGVLDFQRWVRSGLEASAS